VKTLVIDAICGVGFPTLSIAIIAEKRRMADFIDRHRWRRERLEAMSLPELERLYTHLREARDENKELPADPSWAQDLKTDVQHAN